MIRCWSDLHSNLHAAQEQELDHWIEIARERLDFWMIAYYPFQMIRRENGAVLEDLVPEAVNRRLWNCIRERTEAVVGEGYPMFMGYEWQGSGQDGDHNVFFLGLDQPMIHPMRYAELYAFYGEKAIAIPHHLAYQLGSRGKNWQTHIPSFSPFAEIYSSHGCSENDTGPMDMERHLHMGPRTGATCYERGLEMGYPVGCIASGDNHDIPAVADHGTMCVLAGSRAREDIWEGLRARRVYGVSRSRMEIDFCLDDHPMGSVVAPGHYTLSAEIRAADAIDRVEILTDNVLSDLVVHSGTWEKDPLPEGKPVRMKMTAEFGWGPNPRIYPDRLVHHWTGMLRVPGKLLAVDPIFNGDGQHVLSLTEEACRFELTTRMSTATGHWMGPSPVLKESLTFEIEGKPEDEIALTVDGRVWNLPVHALMKSSRILAEYEESRELAESTFGDVTHYRDDLIWHNAYKCRLRQAVPEKAYHLAFRREVDLPAESQIRMRVHLKNGDCAWVSPIFARKEA